MVVEIQGCVSNYTNVTDLVTFIDMESLSQSDQSGCHLQPDHGYNVLKNTLVSALLSVEYVTVLKRKNGLTDLTDLSLSSY